MISELDCEILEHKNSGATSSPRRTPSLSTIVLVLALFKTLIGDLEPALLKFLFNMPSKLSQS